MSAEPYTNGEVEAIRSPPTKCVNLSDDARWLATIDARDAEIARLTKRVEEASDLVAMCAVPIETLRLTECAANARALIATLKQSIIEASDALRAFLRSAPSTPAKPTTGEGG